MLGIITMLIVLKVVKKSLFKKNTLDSIKLVLYFQCIKSIYKLLGGYPHTILYTSNVTALNDILKSNKQRLITTTVHCTAKICL